MSFPPDLQFFEASEFRYPALMNIPFLRWLDRVRARARAIIRRYDPTADVPFVITDGARITGETEPPGSAGRRSLHYIGSAVDIRTKYWSYLQKWCAAQAIHELSYEVSGAVELEMVWSKSDQHWHVGIDWRPGAVPELIEKDE